MSSLIHALGPLAPIVFSAFTIFALGGTLVQGRWLLEARVHRKIDKPGFVQANEEKDRANFQIQLLALWLGFLGGCVFIVSGIVLLVASLLEYLR